MIVVLKTDIFGPRMLCLSNATFMEETVGEKKTRLTVGCVCLMSSFTVCALLIFNGEIETGSFFSLATRQGVPGGKNNGSQMLNSNQQRLIEVYNSEKPCFSSFAAFTF